MNNLESYFAGLGGQSVCAGTYRTQDLIPEFLGVLRHTPEYEQMVSGPFGPIPAHAMDGDESEWWDSDEAAYLLDELFELLNSYAPENHYFGAHPGDGSDFGFWPIEDD